MTAVERDAEAGVAPAEQVLPDGFQVQIDMRCARRGDLRYLVGGSPTRMLRMSDAALGMTSADGRIEVCDPPTRSLARTLLESGIAHPRPMSGPRIDDVAVVIPVCDNQSGVDRLIAALDCHEVIVVDDGSAEPIRVDASHTDCAAGDSSTAEAVTEDSAADGLVVTARPRVRVIRFEENRGPAAARNAGAAAAQTDFVAFLDSDVVPDPEWLMMLLAHFSDPMVALAAPRIVGLSARGGPGRGRQSLAERYENSHSSLDMGPTEASVVPGTPVPYVPSAAMILRRSAFPGFDEDLRVAEDVDLCWRLHEAGWRMRYDPVARVSHDHRTGMRQVLSRRRYYGTGAAFLAQRHGTMAAPMVMTVSMAVAVAALLTRTKIGMVVAFVVLAQAAARLRGRLGDLPGASVVAGQMTGRAAGYGLLQASAAICRHYWPLALIMALLSRRFRRLVIELAVIEGLVEWVRSVISDPSLGPSMGPFSYLLCRRLDDLAYGTGLWEGVVRERDLGALRPVVTR
ncbi:mycofactocin system glycosyltransferase [Gordonia desulfuricans]|uniref:Mycofactocin system glycosyltransferase n=1 Tax=Gordonia desulfuricans TaxID=89051 RepID=A0A7K3LR82_9ACTN|nr:mycofactocin biosynthesis glycosyltransferase MftF [Gordonia desulfuricans]NDK90676.1 mycofactocin system glycosyltransferase [Gordonia desulfuricans]